MFETFVRLVRELTLGMDTSNHTGLYNTLQLEFILIVVTTHLPLARQTQGSNAADQTHPYLRWRASNDTRDRAIIGGVVPNHRSRALQQQPSKMLCHLSPSKAVGHPLTACLVERYVIRTSYRDNASCKSRRNTALFFLYVSKIS